MKTPRYNDQPNPSQNPEVSAFLNLSFNEGIALTYDEELGCSLIEAREPFIYPDLDSSADDLKKLLLKPVGDRKLILPENFVTLGQALNDAAYSYRQGRGQITARELFEELGGDLRKVASESGMVPKDLSYLNVIYSREEGGAKLLPPLEFIQFATGDQEQAKKHVVGSLWQSLVEGASNDAQKRLAMSAYGGFTGTYQW